MAADFNVAGAGFSEERAFRSLKMNAAAAGSRFDVVSGLEASADVT